MGRIGKHESLEKGTRSEAGIENQAKNQPVALWEKEAAPRPLSSAHDCHLTPE